MTNFSSISLKKLAAMSNSDSLVYCGSESTWPLTIAPGAFEGSCPPLEKAEFSIVWLLLGWTSTGTSVTPGDWCSEEPERSSLSGDSGRQWSGMPSSDGAPGAGTGEGPGIAPGVEAGNGPWYWGLGSYSGPWRPGKQITAKYQWALKKERKKKGRGNKKSCSSEFSRSVQLNVVSILMGSSYVALSVNPKWTILNYQIKEKKRKRKIDLANARLTTHWWEQIWSPSGKDPHVESTSSPCCVSSSVS